MEIWRYQYEDQLPYKLKKKSGRRTSPCGRSQSAVIKWQPDLNQSLHTPGIQ